MVVVPTGVEERARTASLYDCQPLPLFLLGHLPPAALSGGLVAGLPASAGLRAVQGAPGAVHKKGRALGLAVLVLGHGGSPFL